MVGAAAGAVTALFYAPKKGEELRHDVGAKAREVGRKAGEAWGDMKQGTASVARTATGKAREAIGKGQHRFRQYKSRVQEAIAAGRQAAEEKRAELEAQVEEKTRESST